MTDEIRKDDSDDEVREFPLDGPWRAILRCKDRVTYYPRNPSGLPRFEWTLPNGQDSSTTCRKASSCGLSTRPASILRVRVRSAVLSVIVPL